MQHCPPVTAESAEHAENRFSRRPLRSPRLLLKRTLDYLNRLNQQLLTAVEKDGEAFLSNALIGGTFVLRACIVNFHTSLGDIEALPVLLSRLGEEVRCSLESGEAL